MREKANYSFGFGLGTLLTLFVLSGSDAPSWSRPLVFAVGIIAVSTAVTEFLFARKREGKK